MNARFKILEVNESFLNFFGYSSEEPIDLNLSAIFADEKDYDYLRAELKGYNQVKDFEVVLINNRGEKKICMINCVFIPDQTSDFCCYQGIIYDLTLRKKAEKDMVVAERLSMTGKLARTIAHEVRNPLANLNLALEHLRDEMPKDNEAVQLYSEIIERNAKRIDTLITEMLNSSKPKDLNLERPPRPVDAATPRLKLVGARQHNQRDLTVGFPLRRLTCLTGVSGSGKSTLIQDVLFPALTKHLGEAAESPGVFDRLENVDNLRGVVMVDQSPIGKSSRSNPVSYVGAWDPIRALFAALPEAKQRGYTPGTFSFNAGHGRCPTCTGSSFEHVEMQFLSDVWLRCPDCDGKRYRPEVLELQWNGLSVAGSGADGARGAGRVPLASQGARRARAAGRRRPRLPAPRPAGAYAVGRGGTAPEARRASG